MAFFGLTTFGHEDPVADATAQTQHYTFHMVSDEDYMTAFKKFVLGDSALALQLEVNGSETILRKHVGDILTEILGCKPSKSELTAWFTFLDFDGSATLSMDEFLTSVHRLKGFSERPDEPKQYKSYVDFHTNWHKHRRMDYDPQHTLKGPMTASQEVGWHGAKPPVLHHQQFYPLSQTDVTIREGRNKTHYYGHFVCPK